MAAKVFQIIGIVVIIITVLISVLILPFLSRLLKRLNKALSAGRPDIAREMSQSLHEIEAAQGQIEAVTAMTESVKSGMQAAIGVADKVVEFLESGVFQVGLPVLLWFLILVTSIIRGLQWGRKGKESTIAPIPPPSWEAEA